MGLVKKILISPDGWESTIKISEDADEQAIFFWQKADDILQYYECINFDLGYYSGNYSTRAYRVGKEILSMGSFNYGDANPDYTAIEVTDLFSELKIRSGETPNPFYNLGVDQPVYELLGVFSINQLWLNEENWLEWVEENIYDYDSGSDLVYLRQPFWQNISKTDETASGANDGTLTFEADSWGGNTPYEYSIDNGVTWQSGSSFLSLSPDVYDCKMKDADSNESNKKEIEILAGA